MKLNMSDVSNLVFKNVDHKEFHDKINKFRSLSCMNSANVHEYTLKEYSKMITFLSSDKESGYAIKNDGELVSVHSSIKGRGKILIADAVRNGARKLNAYDIDGFLIKLYGSFNFKEVFRAKFDENLADPNNKLILEKKPDYVEMEIVENEQENIDSNTLYYK